MRLVFISLILLVSNVIQGQHKFSFLHEYWRPEYSRQTLNIKGKYTEVTEKHFDVNDKGKQKLMTTFVYFFESQGALYRKIFNDSQQGENNFLYTYIVGTGVSKIVNTVKSYYGNDSFTYSRENNIKTVIPESGGKQTFTFNSTGWVYVHSFYPLKTSKPSEFGMKLTFEYNNDHTIKEMVYEGGNGVPIYKYTYSYDSFKNPVKWVMVDTKGKRKNRIAEYTYTYDSNGDWTKRVCKETDLEYNISSVSVIERSFK